jgi:transposase
MSICPRRSMPRSRSGRCGCSADHRQDYPSDTALAEAVGKKLEIGRETARRWLVQADINAGARPGASTDEQAEIKRLRAENKRLREDNEILRAATVSSPGSSTPAIADHGVHRRHAQCWSRGRVDLCGPVRTGLPGRRADLPSLASSQPPGGGSNRLRRGADRCSAECPWHCRGPLRPPEDDPTCREPATTSRSAP